MENTLSILNNIFFWVIFATVALALINYAVRKYNARILPNKGGGLKCFSLSEFIRCTPQYVKICNTF